MGKSFKFLNTTSSELYDIFNLTLTFEQEVIRKGMDILDGFLDSHWS